MDSWVVLSAVLISLPFSSFLIQFNVAIWYSGSSYGMVWALQLDPNYTAHAAAGAVTGIEVSSSQVLGHKCNYGEQ